MSNLAEALSNYGADEASVLSLGDELQPTTVAYVDLVSSRADRPDAVVREPTGTPIAYVVDGRERSIEADAVARLRRVLAFRGDAGFLAVVRPGRLDAYELSLTEARAGDEPAFSSEKSEPSAKDFFPRLTLTPDVPAQTGQAIHRALFELMKEAIDAIHAPRGAGLSHLVERHDALSLVGRAVFIRFLLDRELLTSDDSPAVALGAADPRHLFDTPAIAAQTWGWLDRTFNGDLLPVSFDLNAAELTRRIRPEGWRALRNILWNAPGGQLPMGATGDGPLGWSGLDFSRIPVGVLSQVYEQQAHDWDPKSRREKSVYYTPTTIAGFMVAEALQSNQQDVGPSHELRVLDPAVGGGVFLVASFRELVSQYWRGHGERPETPHLRHILYEQLRGFDIELTALRLTALSLYLAAIELDPTPLPLEGLRFDRPMVGTTLHFVGGEGPAGIAGSLGRNVGVEHDGAYDVVIGNPPWTSKKVNKAVRAEILSVLRPIVAETRPEGVGDEFILPDGNPDIGFVWRAARWCKPGGRIALVTHARVLFKQSDVGCAARNALFGLVTWTGIVNGAAVRQTEVWPNVDAPFALLFGVNERPRADGGFYFFSPYLERPLNRRGRLRIDEKAAVPVRLGTLKRAPYLLKVLFRGTTLDLDIVRAVEDVGPTVEEYWLEDLGLTLGHGYQVALASGRRDASFLLNFPDITARTVGRRVEIDLASTPKFRKPEVCWPRKPEIYQGPLVLVRKSVVNPAENIAVFLAASNAAYSESFYGFSAFGHPQPVRHCQYLALVLSTPLMRWHALMTSAQYGVERDALYFEDVKRLPIPRYADLDGELKSAVPVLWAEYASSGVVGSNHAAWAQSIYGLSADDWQVIEDTLAVGGPRKPVTDRASAPPSKRTVAEYSRTLELVLSTALGVSLTVRPADEDNSPWQWLSVSPTDRPLDPLLRARPEPDLARLADVHSASAIVLYLKDSIVLGRLKQGRYWTRSRARLSALELLRNHDAVSILGYV